MSLLKIAVKKLSPLAKIEFGNLEVCCPFHVLYPFVALLKATYAETSHIVLIVQSILKSIHFEPLVCFDLIS